jgi:NADPH-dependent curcumin reductase CurA
MSRSDAPENDRGSMTEEANRQVHLVARPAGLPDENCFKLVTSSIPRPSVGQMLLKTRFISIDPYMRRRMNDRPSYVSPFQLNEVINGGVVGEVVETKSGIFKMGDFVVGNPGRQDYSVAGENDVCGTHHGGLENAPQTFIGLFAGENPGKQLVKVSA